MNKRLNIRPFSEDWFRYWQPALLFFCNFPDPAIRERFRDIIGINEIDSCFPVIKITPNSYHCKVDKFTFQADFRVCNTRAIRIKAGFQKLWETIHRFDMGFANRFIPALNLGFDDYTGYPDAHTETSTVDGYAGQSYSAGAGVVWADIIAAGGNVHSDTSASNYIVNMYCDGGGTNKWRSLLRGMYLFNTGSIDADALISNGTFSVYGSDKGDANGFGIDINLYSSNPAANNDLVAGDFDSLGSTAFSTAIIYANYSTTGYNDFALNAAGKSAIVKAGITKLGLRDATHDVGGSAPTWKSNTTASHFSGYYAEDTTAGNGKDPKLAVTYSLPAAGGGLGFFPFLR